MSSFLAVTFEGLNPNLPSLLVPSRATITEGFVNQPGCYAVYAVLPVRPHDHRRREIEGVIRSLTSRSLFRPDGPGSTRAVSTPRSEDRSRVLGASTRPVP